MGRSSNSVYLEIKEQILSKELVAGQYLPAIRALGEQYQVANGTVHSALKKLVMENIIVSENRKGFRVLNVHHQFFDGLPIAYIEVRDQKGVTDELHESQMKQALIKVAREKGIALLEMNCFKNKMNRFVSQLEVCHIGGLVFDSFQFEEKVTQQIMALCLKRKIPIVVLESAENSTLLDCILQDNYGGGYQAADWAIAHGYRDFLWLCPHLKSSHKDGRLGGVLARLARENCFLREDAILPVNYKSIEGINELKERLVERLQCKEKPVFIFALWSGMAYVVSQVYQELGLKIGSPHSFISWTAEELYGSIFRDTFESSFVPPVVVWSSYEAAVQTLDRLLFRKRFPESPIVRLLLSSRIKLS